MLGYRVIYVDNHNETYGFVRLSSDLSPLL